MEGSIDWASVLGESSERGSFLGGFVENAGRSSIFVGRAGRRAKRGSKMEGGMESKGGPRGGLEPSEWPGEGGGVGRRGERGINGEGWVGEGRGDGEGRPVVR